MVQLKDIQAFLNSTVDGSQEITKVLSIDDPAFDSASLGWCSDKNKESLLKLKEGTIIVSKVVFAELKDLSPSLNLIEVENCYWSHL